MITKNYYEILWISPSATETEIKSAFRKQARLAHPDRGGKSFVEVNEAYQVLSDLGKRSEYDLEFKSWIETNALQPCLKCGTANRLSQIPSGKRPICGRCKSSLPVDEPKRKSQLKTAILNNLGGAIETVGAEAILLVQDAAVAGIGHLRGKLRGKRG